MVWTPKCQDHTLPPVLGHPQTTAWTEGQVPGGKGEVRGAEGEVPWAEEAVSGERGGARGKEEVPETRRKFLTDPY